MLTVWLPMCSSVAPMARREVEWTSLAMNQGKTLPVPAHILMFQVGYGAPTGGVGRLPMGV